MRRRRRFDTAQPRSIRIDTGQPASPPIPAPVPRSAVDAVEARDRAILAFLGDGGASFQAVLAALHEQDDWTDAQRAEACTLALRRLCLTKRVVRTGDTYVLSSVIH